jgi:hypothetical protein
MAYVIAWLVGYVYGYVCRDVYCYVCGLPCTVCIRCTSITSGTWTICMVPKCIDKCRFSAEVIEQDSHPISVGLTIRASGKTDAYTKCQESTRQVLDVRWWLLKSNQLGPRSNQISWVPDQIKSNQIKSNSNQILKSAGSQIKSNQIKSNQTQIKSSNQLGPRSNQIKSNEIKLKSNPQITWVPDRVIQTYLPQRQGTTML